MSAWKTLERTVGNFLDSITYTISVSETEPCSGSQNSQMTQVVVNSSQVDAAPFWQNFIYNSVWLNISMWALNLDTWSKLTWAQCAPMSFDIGFGKLRPNWFVGHTSLRMVISLSSILHHFCHVPRGSQRMGESANQSPGYSTPSRLCPILDGQTLHRNFLPSASKPITSWPSGTWSKFFLNPNPKPLNYRRTGESWGSSYTWRIYPSSGVYISMLFKLANGYHYSRQRKWER